MTCYRRRLTGLITSFGAMLGTACVSPGGATPSRFEVAGRILDDQSGAPLDGAIVSLRGTKFGAPSLDGGYYHIAGKLAAGTYTLDVHFVGYGDYEQPVTIPANASLIQLEDIRLSAADIALWPVCVPELREPGLEVEVRDSVTNAALTDVATVTADDGARIEVLTAVGRVSGDSGAISVTGAVHRPGTYTVAVSVPGYREWERRRVQVERGDCSVVTEVLLVRMQRR